MQAQAAWQAVQIPLRAAQRGRSMAELALCGAQSLTAWRHYPRSDARDTASGCSFYFHAHNDARSAEEHGHFHLFMRLPQAGGFQHLAALSIDNLGRPLRWFATNAWVTGEQWQPALRMRDALPQFALQMRGPAAPVGRWLEALVRLHQDALAELLERRDATLGARQAATLEPLERILADRDLDLLAESPVNLGQRLQQLQASLDNDPGDD
ncbi:DUF6969 family protein [Roseateles microcysteis]|uniref:DUF6969 family protein n=1 Tax=Roseateles microcysteis TaxID=3119057 RepID=UPI002FE52572